jgi:hypothetical protein
MEPSIDIKNLLVRFYKSFAQADVATIESLISRQTGILFIGSDPQEWWGDYHTLLKVFKAQSQEMGGGGVLEILPGEAQAYTEGTVGWVADQPTMRLPDGTEIGLRATAVLHKEGGAWKFIQGHFSIGVPNKEAVGKPLTVS